MVVLTRTSCHGGHAARYDARAFRAFAVTVDVVILTMAGGVPHVLLDLLTVTRLVEDGRYRPVVDRTYAMDDAVEANRYVESCRKTGSVVIRVSR